MALRCFFLSNLICHKESNVTSLQYYAFILVAYNLFISRAGLPATTVLSSTSFLTTEPAPTTAFSSTVTPGNIVASAPIQQLRFKCTGLHVKI